MADTIEVDLATVKRVIEDECSLLPRRACGCIPDVRISPTLQEELRDYVEERRESIQKGARRAPYRFRS